MNGTRRDHELIVPCHPDGPIHGDRSHFNSILGC